MKEENEKLQERKQNINELMFSLQLVLNQDSWRKNREMILANGIEPERIIQHKVGVA